MATYRQPGFGSGELSPSMWGRHDSDRYPFGLRTCLNLFVDKHGSAVSRPGMLHVGNARLSTGTVRLVPFVYAEDDSCVLEFGEGYLRVWRYDSVNAVTELKFDMVTPIHSAHLERMQVLQSGNLVTLLHPDYFVLELRRNSDTDWELGNMSLSRPAAPSKETTPSVEPRLMIFGTFDTEGPNVREWEYMVTRLVKADDGTVTESDPFKVAKYIAGLDPDITHAQPIPDKFAVNPENHFNIWVPGAQDPNTDGYMVYRGRNGVWSFVARATYAKHPVAYAAHDGWYAYDSGEDPDIKIQAPKGTNPFAITVGNYTRYENPRAGTYHEGRLILASTAERPETLWLSAVEDFLNFDRFIPVVATHATEFDLVSSRHEEIRHLLSRDRLLAFTSSSVWAITGPDGNPISPADGINFHIQQEIGSSWLRPLVVGDTALFVRTKGGGVRDLAYDAERRAYAGSDVSVYSQHLLDGHAIVDWCYAEDPWGVVWAVRDDGTLLSYTYSRETQVWAWARHDTQGTVEAVCAVPEGNEDVVYLAVKRDGTRRIEKFATRTISSVDGAVCLDAAVVSKKFMQPGDTTVTITGLNHLEGQVVRALVGGAAAPETTVIGGSATFPATSGMHYIVVGLAYTCRLETLDVPDKTRSKIVKRVIWEVEASRGLWTGTGQGLWAGDIDRSREWRQRKVADGFGVMDLYTGEVDVPIVSSWGKHGRAVLEQRDPLPINIKNVTRVGEIGG